MPSLSGRDDYGAKSRHTFALRLRQASQACCVRTRECDIARWKTPVLRSSEPESGSRPKVEALVEAARWRCLEVCVESMTACSDWRKAALCSRGLTCLSWCDQDGASDALGGEDECSLSVWSMKEETGRGAGSPLGES